jgi:hypothetical protein
VFTLPDSQLDTVYEFQPDTIADPVITLNQISAQINGYIEIILMEREEVVKHVSDDDFEINSWDDDDTQFFGAGEFKIRQVWEVQTPKMEYPACAYYMPDAQEEPKGHRNKEQYGSSSLVSPTD